MGLDCDKEVAILKRELGPLVGGADKLAFDILNAKMTVSSEVEAGVVLKAVGRAGMRAELWETGPRLATEETF